MGVKTPQRKVSPSQMYGVPLIEKPHTLKNYALEHFRSPMPSPKSSLAGTMQRSGLSGFSMWSHTRNPFSQPLLRRLLNKEELAHQACIIFQSILRYMGDIPGRQTPIGLELTDTIFSGPLKQVQSLSINRNPCEIRLRKCGCYRKSCVTRSTARS